jgi:hypothetical protein
MKRNWIFLIAGLAVGIALVALGTLVIGNGSTVGLAVGIEDGNYYLLHPDKTAIEAGALMIASGSIITSVSLVGIARLWKEKKGV